MQQELKDQGVYCDIVSPGNVRCYIHMVSPS